MYRLFIAISRRVIETRCVHGFPFPNILLTHLQRAKDRSLPKAGFLTRC